MKVAISWIFRIVNSVLVIGTPEHQSRERADVVIRRGGASAHGGSW